MCGRFFLVTDDDALVEEFQAIRDNPLERTPIRWNIAPTQRTPVVGLRDGVRVLRALRWGLVPARARHDVAAARHINARAEGLFERAMFRDAARARRCLVPASGFYEWQGKGKTRSPYALRPSHPPLMAFAGIWERWSASDGTELRSFAIITVAANTEVRALHERMPAILPRARWDAWLSRDTPRELLTEMLAPAPDGTLTLQRVDGRVGNVRHDDAALLDPPAPLDPPART